MGPITDLLRIFLIPRALPTPQGMDHVPAYLLSNLIEFMTLSEFEVLREKQIKT